MSTNYEPYGYKFFDAARGQEMMHCQEGPWEGWLLYKHPDGQWVSLRKATADDILKLGSAIVKNSRQKLI